MPGLPDPAAARFRWGQGVRAAVDLYNDGSLPDAPEDALLVVAGGPGEVVQVGTHEASGTPVYLVDFGVAVLGCLQDELQPDDRTPPDLAAPDAAAGSLA